MHQPAQYLILRHRVKDYRAGDLEHRYSRRGIAEDFFINYGFVTTSLQALMIRARRVVCPPRASKGGQVRTANRPGFFWMSCANADQYIPASRRPLLARRRQELLGRLVECHDSPTRRPAIPRLAARSSTRRRHSHLCDASARAFAHRSSRLPRAPRHPRRRRDLNLRSSSGKSLHFLLHRLRFARTGHRPS